MRRSNSLSQIPIARQENSSVRPRGRSTQRISREKSWGSIQRNNPTNNVNKGITATPNFRGSYTNFSTPLSRPSPGGSAKADRPVNDKKWISEQLFKVREYLQSKENCDPLIVNRLNPLTINTFVYVIGLLVREIDPNIDINMANYKEVVLPLLKSFRYPGTVSNSLLKTVNTKHAWPQVIGILSWLVDLINVLKPKPHTIPMEEQVHDHLIEYMAMRYHRYNYSQDTTDLDQAHIEKLFKILDFDLERVAEFKSIESELEDQKQSQLQQLSENEKEVTNMRQEIERMQNEIETFYSEDGVKEEQVNNEIKSLNGQILKLEEKVKLIDENIEKLRKSLKEQPCTLEEKAEMLQKIKETERKIELKQEKNHKWLEIKTNLDLKLVELIQQAEDKVSRFNYSLMEIALIYPDLKVLTIADSGFHHQNYKDELHRVSQNIKKFEKEIREKITKTKYFIDGLQMEKEKLKDSNKEVVEHLMKLVDSEKRILDQTQAYKEELNAIVKEVHEEEQALSDLLEQLDQSEPNTESQREEIEKFKEVEQQKVQHLEEYQANCLNIFVKFYNSSLSRLNDMEQCRQRIVDKQLESLESIEQQQAEILQALKMLKELKNL